MLYKGEPLVNEIVQDFKYPDVFKSHNGWFGSAKKASEALYGVFTR